MRVDEIRVRAVTLENVTLRTSYGKNVTRREHLFVSVRAGGVEGIGEGSPLPHFSGERASEMAVVTRDVFAPALLGRDPFDLEGATKALDAALPHHHASKSALVSALVDLQGRSVGVPAHRLLGGSVRSEVAVGGAVGIEEVDVVIERVRRQFDAGTRTFKLKVGTDPRRDVHVLHRLREEFGFDVELRADANSGLDANRALRFARDVEDVRLQYFEQPLPAKDLRGLARLRASVATPIAVDESLFGVRDALEIVRHDAADVLIIKLIKLGGLHAARKVAAIAEAAGLRCVSVSPYETVVGVAANVHLVASSSVFPYASELGTGVSEVALPGASELAASGGFVKVPDAPGLGVEAPRGFFDQADVVRAGVVA